SVLVADPLEPLAPKTSDFDFDVRAIDPNVIAIDGLGRRRSEHLASSYVEHRAMPGTGYFVALDFAFAKRPAYVRAVIIEGMENAADIEERDLFSIYFDHPGLPGGNVV